MLEDVGEFGLHGLGWIRGGMWVSWEECGFERDLSNVDSWMGAWMCWVGVGTLESGVWSLDCVLKMVLVLVLELREMNR